MRRNERAAFLVALAILVGRETHATESSLGVELGYVKAKTVEATLFLAGDYRFHLAKAFALAPEFSYWKKSQTGLGVSASLEDIQFGVRAVGVFRASRTVELFVAGGGGLHHFTGNLGVIGGAALSDSTTKGGLNIGGGLDLKAGDNLSFFMAARYDWVLGLEVEEEQSRLDQKKFSGGFRVRF